MKRIKNFDLKKIMIISIIALVVISTIGLYLYKESKGNNENINMEENTENEEILEERSFNDIEENQEVKGKIVVHITGEVENQGVVELRENSRIVDAIEAAGGETENADLNRLNLAYILSDGDKIYVPNKNEKEIENENGYMETENTSLKENEIKINLNTATIEDLVKLPGIGESTAKKIIEYRNKNGKIKVKEELKNIPGIGDSKFDKIKEKIIVK